MAGRADTTSFTSGFAFIAVVVVRPRSKEAMKQLKALGGVPDTPTSANTPNGKGKTVTKASVTDCCICLFSVTVQQALFIA